MKRIFYIICITTLLFGSCKPDIDGTVGEPTDKVKGIEGTWRLSSFIQKDMNNPIQEERDFSDFYIQEGTDPLTITFAAADRSYDVMITEGKNFFGTNGTWSYDNDAYPTFITFDDGSTANEFELGSTVREFDNVLTVELVKGCSETSPNVIYKFNFDRIQ